MRRARLTAEDGAGAAGHRARRTEELDPTWTLMRYGLPTTPSREEWLVDSANVERGGRVGIDSRLISVSAAKTLRDTLSAHGRTLITEPHNLVDAIWTDRPPRTLNPVGRPHRSAGAARQDGVAHSRLPPGTPPPARPNRCTSTRPTSRAARPPTS